MKGFTLLETLVTVLIFTFIMAGMYGVLNIAKTNYDTNLVSLNLQRQARQGMSWLSREIRQASWDSIHDKDTERNSITFDRPDVNGGTVYNVTYSLVSGQLWRNYPTGQVIANNITGLTFSQIVGNVQKIILEASKTFRSLGKDRPLTFSLTEQVQVRNP